MKKVIISMFIFSLTILFVAPSAILAAPDSVTVSALPLGNLNNTINGDTTAGGFAKPNTVYVLQQTTSLDTVYYMTAPITVKGSVHIAGKINPTTGHPPVIAPSIAGDNSSIGYFFRPQGHDTLSLKGLYFIGTRVDGNANTGRFVSPNGNGTVYIFDHCVLENISGEGTPNLFDTWEKDSCSFYVTNCIFRNNQDDNPQNPGFAWIDPGTIPCDTAIFRNNTFFLTGGYILGSSGYGARYLEFNHNTIFYSAQGGAFPIYQLHHAIVKNNIFYSVSSACIPISWYGAPGSWGAGVFMLDSLRSLTGDPWNMTEADRDITITDNVYYWPQVISDKWTELNAGIQSSDPLRPPDFVNAQPGILTDKVTWPNVTVADNDSVDPGFDATLDQAAGNNMASFIETCWTNGGTALGERPYLNPLSNPPTWEGVASDWATTQGYPVPENLRYSNTLTGDDGLPVGDLNWFPEYLTDIDDDIANSLPTEISLNQNYPNPFNPTTKIIYSLPETMKADLIVYDLTGRKIKVLRHGTQRAGEHVVDFDGSNLSSGVYIYMLKTDKFTESRKMMLLK